MSTLTQISSTNSLTTIISVVGDNGSESVVGNLTTEVEVTGDKEIQLVNVGVPGRKGDVGPQGPIGPEYQGNDLPDFTLIFDNKLI